MLDTHLVGDYLKNQRHPHPVNPTNMVHSIDIPAFYNNRLPPMTDELLSLKWNNHKTTFADVLCVLRDQEVYVDVSLACGGKVYPAHKFVLSTCSDYFREMFSRTPCKHPVVFMKDVAPRDLEALLDFMYRGEVNVPHTHLSSLIKTAEALSVKGLAIPDEEHTVNGVNSTTPGPHPLHRGSPIPLPQCSPPLKRRRKEEYPVMGFYGGLPGMRHPMPNIPNMVPIPVPVPEPVSPYDLSQKSLSSSIDRSSERSHSASPGQETGPDRTRPESSTPRPKYDNFRFTPKPPKTEIREKDTRENRDNRENREVENNKDKPERVPSPTGEERSREPSPEINGEDPLPGPSGLRPKSESPDMDVEVKEDPSSEGVDSEWSRQDEEEAKSLHKEETESYKSGSNGPTQSFSALYPALDLSSKPPLGHDLSMPYPPSSPRSPRSQSAGPSIYSHGPLTPRALWDGSSPNTLPPLPMSGLGSLPSQLQQEEILCCPICNKHFPKKRKSNLQVHLRTHTGERPFRCPRCSRGFKQKAHLEKHQEKSCHIVADYVPYPFFPKI